MDIKVLGPGCPKCQQTEKIVKEAVAEAGVDAQIEKVTDTMEIAGYGVFGTPAVVVDGEVKSVGKIPKNRMLLAGLIIRSIDCDHISETHHFFTFIRPCILCLVHRRS